MSDTKKKKAPTWWWGLIVIAWLWCGPLMVAGGAYWVVAYWGVDGGRFAIGLGGIVFGLGEIAAGVGNVLWMSSKLD